MQNLTLKEKFNLALQNHRKNNLKTAENLYSEILTINPNYVDAHNNLGILFNKLGEHQKAISCYEKAIQIQPQNLTSKWLCMNTFPVIYKNYEEINHYNYKFKKNIEKINKLLDMKSNYSKKDLISALNSSTNFFFALPRKGYLRTAKRLCPIN